MTPSERDRQRELLYREPANLTMGELLEMLRLRHTADAPPPCRVCGGPLTPVSSGQGPTKWACSIREEDPDDPGKLRLKPGRRAIDDHYAQSTWYQERHGEPWVLELINRIENDRMSRDT